MEGAGTSARQGEEAHVPAAGSVPNIDKIPKSVPVICGGTRGTLVIARAR